MSLVRLCMILAQEFRGGNGYLAWLWPSWASPGNFKVVFFYFHEYSLLSFGFHNPFICQC